MWSDRNAGTGYIDMDITGSMGYPCRLGPTEQILPEDGRRVQCPKHRVFNYVREIDNVQEFSHSCPVYISAVSYICVLHVFVVTEPGMKFAGRKL